MRIIKKRTLILVLLCISLGFFLGYKVFVDSKKTKEAWIVPNLQDISKKFITEETLVNEIHQKQELITLEVQMTEKVTLDDSWGSLTLFKKIQSVNYAGTGTYVVDLSNLKAENIKIDNSSNKVTVKVSAPTIKDVNLNLEKTEYQTPEKGPLRFGEIKLTLEENQMLERNVKDKMLKKMTEPNFTDQAIKSTDDTLKSLIENILQNKTDDKYNVNVEYETIK